jgi:hypothetical protein
MSVGIGCWLFFSRVSLARLTLLRSERVRTLLRSRGLLRQRPEDEVVGLAPAGGDLVLAQERDQLGLQVDGADACLGLGYGDMQDGAGEVDVTPAEVDQLGDAQSAGDDRGGEQGAVASGVLEQDLDLLAVQTGAGGGLLLELGDLALDGVVGDQVVADGHVEDLSEPDEGLVIVRLLSGRSTLPCSRSRTFAVL